MFRIRNDSDNDLNIIRIENGKNDSLVTIVPEFGANVSRLQLELNGKAYSLLDGNHSQKEFAGQRMFNGTHLVPFPNRVKDGRYRLRGKEYRLNINYKNEGNAAHGFIHNSPFQVISKQEEEHFGEIILHYSYDGSGSGYPFPFEITFTYLLSDESGLVCTVVVTNNGKETMPFGAGWHPYFSLGKKVDHLRLKLPPVVHLLLNDTMIPTGEEELDDRFSRETEIGRRQMDTLFRFREPAKKHIVQLNDPLQDISLQVWMEGDKFEFCQIYIPPHRQSIAIEPMTCAIDCFNNSKGIVFIKPGKSFKGSFGVQLK